MDLLKKDTRNTDFDITGLLYVFHLIVISIYYSQSSVFLNIDPHIVFYYLFGASIIFIIIVFFINRGVFFVCSYFLLGTIFYSFIFSAQFGVPFTGGLVASYPGIYLTAAFAILAHSRDWKYALRLIFIASILYEMLFLGITFTLDNASFAMLHSLGLEKPNSVIVRHGMFDKDVGDLAFRIKISPMNLAFSLFYSLFLVFQKRSIVRLSLLAFSVFCIYISDFRFLAVTSLVSTIVPFLPIKRRTLAKLVICLNCFVMAVFLVAALTDVNLFQVLSFDETGSIRAMAADIAIDWFQRFPIFGVGLRNDGDDYKNLFSSMIFSPTDIGYFGSLLQYGLFGYLFIFLSNCIIYRFVKEKCRSEKEGYDTLMLQIFSFIVLYQLISPFIWEDSGSIILGLAVGYAVPNGLKPRGRDIPGRKFLSPAGREC